MSPLPWSVFLVVCVLFHVWFDYLDFDPFLEDYDLDYPYIDKLLQIGSSVPCVS